jgi:peroxiredoxin
MQFDAAKLAMAEAIERARNLDAPIADRLGIVTQAFRQHCPPYVAAVDRLVERLNLVGAGGLAPGIGEPMPMFLLPDDAGRLVGLDELIANGPLAIAFHRGHWCPYCRTNAYALAGVYEQLTKAGGQLIAITPERECYTKRHKEDARAGFHLLSDVDNGYALSLNLAIWIGDELKLILRDGFGRDLPAYHGNDAWVLPIPATFVVDAAGIIRARFVDPDYRRRMDIDALLEALSAARSPAQPIVR